MIVVIFTVIKRFQEQQRDDEQHGQDYRRVMIAKYCLMNYDEKQRHRVEQTWGHNQIEFFLEAPGQEEQQSR